MTGTCRCCVRCEQVGRRSRAEGKRVEGPRQARGKGGRRGADAGAEARHGQGTGRGTSSSEGGARTGQGQHRGRRGEKKEQGQGQGQQAQGMCKSSRPRAQGSKHTCKGKGHLPVAGSPVGLQGTRQVLSCSEG